MAASRERILCPWSSPGATTPGPRGLTAYPRKEATMQPSLFDLEVWADYQQSKMRRARQQADLPSPPSRLRIRATNRPDTVVRSPQDTTLAGRHGAGGQPGPHRPSPVTISRECFAE